MGQQAPAVPSGSGFLVTIKVHQEGNSYVAEAVELDVTSFGSSVDEALQAVMDATVTYLEALEKEGVLDQVLAEKGLQLGQLDDRFEGSIEVIELELQPRELVSRWPISVPRPNPGEATALAAGV